MEIAIEIRKTNIEGRRNFISDGSLKELYGTSPFTFVAEGLKKSFVGGNRIPGDDNEQSSYRSELCGILKNIILINIICNLYIYIVKIGYSNHPRFY